MISELQLMRTMPIEIDSCKVHPLTLGEIYDLSEQTYYAYLRMLTLSKSDIDKSFINSDVWSVFESLDDFDFLLGFVCQEQELLKKLLASLSLFLREKVNFDLENGLFIKRDSGNFIITKDIFNRIKEVISKQNYLNNNSSQDEEYKPHDDKARELIEKIKKFRKLKQDSEAQESLGLPDIISIIASLSPSYNFNNVWDLTIYQLYTIFTRMGMKDNYDTQIYLLPHSSSDKSPELKHWMSKIQK